MAAIIADVEGAAAENDKATIFDPTRTDAWDFANAGARAAALLSFTLPLKAIVTLTRDGRTGSLLSGYRPRAPIVAITPQVSAAQRLALCWGVLPRLGLPPEDLEETVRIATALLVREKVCQKGDAFALVVGWPPSSNTNTVKLHRL